MGNAAAMLTTTLTTMTMFRRRGGRAGMPQPHRPTKTARGASGDASTPQAKRSWGMHRGNCDGHADDHNDDDDADDDDDS